MEHPKFGSDFPFAEPPWYRGFRTAVYSSSHVLWRAKVRDFVEKEILPYVSQWEDQMICPKFLQRKAYLAGIYGTFWPAEYGGTPNEIVGATPDLFHELIYFDEIGRCGSVGVHFVFSIVTMGLPPLLKLGPEWMKQTVGRECITGEKHISLAITEPWAGSDVSGLQTTAIREGDNFIINGVKKYITLGFVADYYTVAARTALGITLFLIERWRDGVRATKMKLQGNWTAGTSVIAFDDVKIPSKNMIGEEGKGFKAILQNFNHERFVMSVHAVRSCRVLLENCIRFARQRKTFGQRLVDHQVIQHKVADMARRTESNSILVEHFALQLNHDSTVPVADIGGLGGVVKVNCTRDLEYCAREASQILGGASYVRTGPGEVVERIYREVRSLAIPGGSEEILLTLAVKQAKL